MAIIGGLVVAAIAVAMMVRQVEPWTTDQLMEPAALAAKLKNIADQPVVICVGPAGIIRGSVETGAAHEAANLVKLREVLVKQDRKQEIVIYCGCCPFARCPNIRPAFTMLDSLHFLHPRLLNLPHNIKVDWIDRGYPVKEGQ